MKINEGEKMDKDEKHKKRKQEEEDKEGPTMAHKRRRTQMEPLEKVKYITILTGSTIKCHNVFMENLHMRIPDLKMESDIQFDVVLIFYSHTHNEAALNIRPHVPVSKPTVIVVVHHTIDPYYIVPDSSRSVTSENTITVDCLFHEDQGLLDCEKNNEAFRRVSAWIEDQRNRGSNAETSKKETAGKISRGSRGTCSPHPHWGVKYECITTGKTLGSHENFLKLLHKHLPDLQHVSAVEECDVMLVFCPIVSRARIDIEAALKQLIDVAGSKPAVLVVLHHTFDPYCIVPDSSRSVTRENTITVDCLFYEDQGLLHCGKNYEALRRAVKWIEDQVSVLHL